MTKNNKHLYLISVMMFFILVAFVFYFKIFEPESGVWIGLIYAPVFLLWVVIMILISGIAFVRNHKSKKGLPIGKSVNPMVLIVVGTLLAIVARFIVEPMVIYYPPLMAVIYLVCAGIFFTGFFPLVKKVFRGKLES